ncbi:MAG: thiamine pyrophosphate-dependent enzyme [Candidatus Eisenbacteria bacterium]
MHSRVYFDLITFVAERFPFLLDTIASEAARCLSELGKSPDRSPAAIESFKEALVEQLEDALTQSAVRVGETTPGVSAAERFDAARGEVIEEIDGQLERQRIAATLTDNERRELLKGMILTRAVDNRLKAFFTSGEVRYENRSFQGKGFRSLGQEAVYAAALRLHRGPAYRNEDGTWTGDVVAPMIRDLGVALGMRSDREIVRQVLSAQMGKSGPPMDGRDLHIGDLSWGILPASAPLGISSLNVAGMAMGFQLADEGRVAISFIGDGGSSLGEWHEAINLAAVRALPAVFCIQNNQTALATPLREQSSVRVFADKAIGYGIPAVTVDGTDPEAIAAAFSWAADRARGGDGPALIELVAMRMCGHAHHDDMLYLGKEPAPSWDYPSLSSGGYANEKAFRFWAERDPIPTYAKRLEALDMIDPGDLETWKKEAEQLVEEEARAVIDAPWPDVSQVGVGVFADEPPRTHRAPWVNSPSERPALPPVEPSAPFDPKGRTFLEAVQLGIGDALDADERVFVYGEDVGGKYGNAFLLLRPLLERHGDRILNSTLAEGGVLGVCVGSAIAGRRPIGEIQFNDFVATGFNQLVNNAAKVRYRWGQGVPMVVRMPWGGLRSAGPFHSQNTEPWFYRVPGLKIVCPSTPEDARALFATAVADPDPVLYYEHIALYRDPRIKQLLPDEAPVPLPFGRAALRRAGDDLAIVSYGAYVHVALRVAESLAEQDGVQASVLDLRTLAPLDKDTLLAMARHCGRMLIVHEDSRTGGIGESLAAVVQEEAFHFLDAPVRIVGALDTPVPYSPPLEEAFLASEEDVFQAARSLLSY